MRGFFSAPCFTVENNTMSVRSVPRVSPTSYSDVHLILMSLCDNEVPFVRDASQLPLPTPMSAV